MVKSETQKSISANILGQRVCSVGVMMPFGYCLCISFPATVLQGQRESKGQWAVCRAQWHASS
jgi:hypothetical protein